MDEVDNALREALALPFGYGTCVGEARELELTRIIVEHWYITRISFHPCAQTLTHLKNVVTTLSLTGIIPNCNCACKYNTLYIT